jgi:hypothetical protein
MTGTTIASTSSNSNTEPSPTESITNPTASSSTSSSPVLIDNHHHTLLSDDDDDEMTSSDDDINNNYEDPLLQSPTKQEDESEPNGNNTTTTPATTTTIASATPMSMIIPMVLDRYSKCFVNGIQQIQNSKAPSLLRNASQECMTWYVAFMASPHHHDKILKFLQYTFYMMSQVVLLVNSSTSPQYSQQQPSNHVASSWWNKLYQEFTWARYILRILQLPIAMDAAIHQSWTIAATPSDNNDGAVETNQRQKLYNVLGRILTYSMVLYYPTELMAYLLWMKPKIAPPSTVVTEVPKSALLPPPSSSSTTTLVCRDNQNGYMISQYIYNFYTTLKRDPKNIHHHNTSSKSSSWLSLFTPSMRCPPPETWSYVSCRCWLIYVITELIQSYVQYKELLLLQSTKKTTASEYRNSQQQIVLQTLRNLLFLIPCTTWSMSQWDTQPIVPLRTVNTLLWFESILSLYQAMIVHRNKHPTPPQEQAPVEPNSTVDDHNTTETI